MIMFEQSRRLSEPLRWGRRERTVVAALLVCAALAVAGLLAYAVSSGSHRRGHCISVTFASTLGAAQLHECGVRARRMCAAPEGLGGIIEEVRAACIGAGYPFRTRTSSGGH